MNITKITENDLKAALELHKNSGVCQNSLRELDEDGQPGKKAAFCVMGLVVGGIAKNRHRGFDEVDSSIDAEGDLTLKVKELAKLESNPIVMNDNYFGNMGVLKQWQGGVLRRLLKSVQKNGPIKLEQ